jgi:hypothetical protein
VQSDDRIISETRRLIGVPVSITEKMDGSNVTLCGGEVYARSVAGPSRNAWHGMVRKHHAWKTASISTDYKVCGEDMYGVHSIHYDGFPEDQTFQVFNILYKDEWLSFDDRMQFCYQHGFSTTPVWRDNITFNSETELSIWLADNIKRGSHHGPEAEGFVVQLMDSFKDWQFDTSLAKYVRSGHVQTDVHWTKNWKPCRIIHPQ